MDPLTKLRTIRDAAVGRTCHGLNMEQIQRFIALAPALRDAIDMAFDRYTQLKQDQPEAFQMDEAKLIQWLREGIFNFYSDEAVVPFVGLGAKGPWIVTSHGAVVYDAGQFGMLGFGHGNDMIYEAVGRRVVAGSVQAPSFSQRAFTDAMFREIGHSRPEGMKHPYNRFMCLSSGSEIVSLVGRICDIHAGKMTCAGAKYEGRTIRMLALAKGFHGRTELPAQISDSMIWRYRKAGCATFRGPNIVACVPINDCAALREAYKTAQRNNVWFMGCIMEPVQGEGNPGVGLTPEFYKLARDLASEHDALFIIDSVQAGFRCNGTLSATDYPGLNQLPPPDMETFAKTISGGEVPLSVLALGQKALDTFVRGTYGNTITAHPRILETAVAMLKQVTPEVRKNIVERGKEFVAKLMKLQDEFPTLVTGVTGTGLLVAAHIDPKVFPVEGKGNTEEWMRRHGVYTTHGGANGIRFTPVFTVTSEEIDLMVEVTRHALRVKPCGKNWDEIEDTD